MNVFALTLLLFGALSLLGLPRSWAAIPLVVVASYLTQTPVLEFGQASFSVLRILVIVGFLRVALRGERISGGLCTLDKIVLIWAAWDLLSIIGHANQLQELIRRIGFVGDMCGAYFLFRVFCRTPQDVSNIVRFIAIMLVPVALEMAFEIITGTNLFAALGAIRASPSIREGRLRAQGPFSHSILAGTVGAICLPLVASLWRSHRGHSQVGIAACLLMVLTSASSGPIMAVFASMAVLFGWRYRKRTREFRWIAVLGYLALSVVMKDPPYFLLARIDLAGGSTGWHRARLIQSSIEHIGEWWLLGTDYTRHWMPTGVSWNPNHTDLTNHYLQMGVDGGILLMALFIGTLWQAFRYVGQRVKRPDDPPTGVEREMWAVGASLFGIAVTCIAVSFFDQSSAYIYLVLAAIVALRPIAPAPAASPEERDAVADEPRSRQSGGQPAGREQG